ncbi:MAG TPA: protein kinase [Phycisphaerales bacterium]|nr:protein kinase [Phycisphaerales bacterium]
MNERIGPYTIEKELGRGGMGEVFLAQDTRLDRQVAIKALPGHLTADADRLTRFQREAKVLASLNHPGIGAIYGLEEAEGRQYLILEFIEGETLAERLVSGAIPVEEALSIARQTAEALEVAHEKGIVHRDVKPGNVMVTPDGVVKVLDFGLARTAEGTPSTTNMPAAPGSPTVHSPTIPGVILGTAGYMSPEQARGKPVDKRSDIFSFGCVVYEVLTGVCPFPGETVTDSLGAILHREPDWALLPPQTPPRVRELLKNCLAKDRRNRLHDIGDARLELDRAIGGHEWASAAASTAVPKQTRLIAISAACAMALTAGGIGWLLASRLPRSAPVVPAQPFHVSTTIPSKPPFSRFVGIAPDARFLVYTARPELELESEKPEGVLVVRRLDRDETAVIEGTEGAQNAALSPNGRWVAFSCAKDRAGTKFTLKKVALENGRPSGKPQPICDLAQGTWFTVGWASDREIVFVASLGTTLYAVAASGGEPRVVFREDASKGVQGWDGFRPLIAGQSILATHFALSGEKVKVNTEVIDLASGKRMLVLRDAGEARLVSAAKVGGKDEEHFLVASRVDLAGLIAARFDPNTLRTLGDPVTVWNGSQVNAFDLSPSGTLAMTTQQSALMDRRLAWIDEKGQPQPIPGTARAFAGMAVSPDGGRVVVRMENTSPDDLNAQVWVQDLTRKTSTRIPIEGLVDALMWSNDGQRIAYGSFTKDEFSVWERPAVASSEAVKLFATPVGQQLYVMPNAWSPDGTILAIAQTDLKASTSDVLMLEQGAGGTTWKATPYLNSAADEHSLRFSPDGKWVLFCSVESGRHELYVQRFTGVGSGAQDAKAGRVQLSTSGHDGGCWWSEDGKEIRFVDGDKQVVSVEVKTEPTFAASVPRVLYSIKELKTRGSSWAPDGRLMVILEGENEQANRIDLVVNFLDELRARMPVPE